MTDSIRPLALAVDGGGTRCRFALLHEEGRLLTEAGSANASTDFDNAVRCVSGGIEVLARKANARTEDLLDLPAFVGLAGVVGRAVTARLASSLPLGNVRYADDRVAALRGALGNADGFVAHCGTGSFFAAQMGGQTQFTGGWGAILGDEASAHWVARKALNLLLQHVDGLLASSPLLLDLLEQFRDAQGVVAFAAQASPAELGAIAPQVTAHAENGDAIAVSILCDGASHIASDLRRMGWVPGLRTCLTGGIGPYYAPYLPEEMRFELAAPRGEPLDGAIALAQERKKPHGHR